MVALLFASATLWTGCVEDPCADVICFNDGTCNEVDGSCDCVGNFTGSDCDSCVEGFEGVDCDVAITAKFTGTYDVIETCDSDPNTVYEYEAVIAPSTDNTAGITIANFFEAFNAEATVSGTDVTIPSQDFDEINLFGTGTLDETTNRITFNYTLTITDETPAVVTECSAFYDLQ